jgi:TIR domain
MKKTSNKKVFISYRRDDTASVAGRVYDRLSKILDPSNVFFDVSTIRGGENFENRIASEIGQSDAALIFIGDKWLGSVQRASNARIWDPGDFVRAEVRAALAQRILVLPILVAGARMPKPEQLPEDVRSIRERNALPLRHESFDDDTENIVAAIFGKSPRERVWEANSGLASKVTRSVVGAIAGAAVLLTGALAHHWMLDRPLSASISTPITVLLIIGSVIFGGWIGWSYRARTPRSRS